MVTKSAKEAGAVIREILLAAGASERNAAIVAEHMVSAHLCGIDTHGVWQLPNYVKAIEAGEIVPDAWPEIIRETPNSALITGNWTFGQVAAKVSMEVALAKAEQQDMAVVSLVQAHHIGRLGYYAEMAAAQQMIALVVTSGHAKDDPRTVPYGGREKVLSTNPLAWGFPAGEEPPMIVDYATTAASGTKVRMAAAKNESVPPGWIVDKDGKPSTDPNDFLAGGAFVPFGGHKGYALMMAMEFLGRIFSGADAFVEGDRGGVVFRQAGVTMIVLRADLFQPFADYAREADGTQRRVRAIAPAPGFKEVLVPGDPEVRTRAIRERDGVPIPDDLWQTLVELATSLGVTVISSVGIPR
jgi:LDH2 family malate/lactate/ureidoglycolate dehydrogenase